MGKLSSSKDPGLFMVIYEDAAALLGLTIAFAGVYFTHHYRLPMIDGISSVLIGIMLMIVAIKMILTSHDLLLGSAADQEIVDRIKALTCNDREVRRIDLTKSMHFAPDQVLLIMKIQFDVSTYNELILATARVRKLILENFPQVKDFYLEAC